MRFWFKLKLRILRWLLNDWRIYDIVSAIRGPDTQIEGLKTIFTERIRALLDLDLPRARHTKEVPFTAIVNAITKISRHDLHYLDHVKSALEIMHDYNIIEQREYQFLRKLLGIIDELVYWDDVERTQIFNMNRLTELIQEYQDFIKYDLEE